MSFDVTTHFIMALNLQNINCALKEDISRKGTLDTSLYC